MESSDGINLGLTGSTGDALTLIQVFAFKRIYKYINNVVWPTHISAVSSFITEQEIFQRCGCL